MAQSMLSTMFPPFFPDLASEFFRGLNQLMEPLIRAGLGAPLFSPVGAIVVETRGRRTGRPLNIPLLGMVFGDMVVVSTVRSGSEWVKNLAANPEVRYWLRGKPVEATAVVVDSEKGTPAGVPVRVERLAKVLGAQSRFCGGRFAILYPYTSFDGIEV
ncbi:MAG: nitroreductase/quinone reductase family protein [Blastocatellia bacterium]